jgi:hypothetical protein
MHANAHWYASCDSRFGLRVWAPFFQEAFFMIPNARGVLWTRVRVATMTAIAGFTIVSAVQTGCSSATPASSEATSLEPLARNSHKTACAPGLTSKEIKGRAFCCEEGAGVRECTEAGTIRPGEACTSRHQRKETTYIRATIDNCVVETCDLNRLAVDFPEVEDELKGTLECRHQPGKGLVWEWETPPATHEVVRACKMASYAYCGSYGYYGTYGFDDGYGGYAYDVDEGYSSYDGYGYGYGGYNVRLREIVPVSSICIDAQGNESECIVGNL